MQTYNEVVRSRYKEAYALSDSPHAEEIKRRVSIPDTETAEAEFSEILKLITDKELREKLDSAAGRLTGAYEKLGFVEGYISEKAYACVI